MIQRSRLPLLLGAVVLQACSSSTNPPAPAAAEPAGSAPAGVTQVVGSAPAGAFVRLEPMFEHEFPPPDGEAFMDQSAQMFVPGAMAARTGQRIEFRSSEDILHNVRVIRTDDKAPIFNVATPPWGSYTYTFDEPGSYDVTCDIHSAMRANILVAATPYVMVADENGAFAFADVVPGSYQLIGFAGEHEVKRVVEISGERVELKVR